MSSLSEAVRQWGEANRNLMRLAETERIRPTAESELPPFDTPAFINAFDAGLWAETDKAALLKIVDDLKGWASDAESADIAGDSEIAWESLAEHLDELRERIGAAAARTDPQVVAELVRLVEEYDHDN